MSDVMRYPETAPVNRNRALVKRLFQVVGNVTLMAVILFAAAGRLDWGWAWALLAAHGVALIINSLVLLLRDPDLVIERSQVPEGSKAWDRRMTNVVMVMILATYLVAGLDARWGWSAPLPLGTHLIGLVGYGLGTAIWLWAMVSNPFFSKLVRIQTERGHTVASGGPYRYVRHPAYAGYILLTFGTVLLLGTLGALIPAVGVGLAYAWRTALEDATLQAELDGYRAYAARVRYRLLPGVW